MPRWHVVNTILETSRAPIYELNDPLGFDGRNNSIHVFGNNISMVHQTACMISNTDELHLIKIWMYLKFNVNLKMIDQ